MNKRIKELAEQVGLPMGYDNPAWAYEQAIYELAELIAAPLQYKIDELMLEYCPNEMTEEQLENYEKHQRPYLDEAIQGLGDI